MYTTPSSSKNPAHGGDRQSVSEPSGWGGGSDQFHLGGPEKPPEKVEEVRGRVFQIGGLACAQAPSSERTTVFLQEEPQPRWGWGLVLSADEVGNGLDLAFSGGCKQQEEKKEESGRREGKVLQGVFSLWNRCHRPQLLCTG